MPFCRVAPGWLMVLTVVLWSAAAAVPVRAQTDAAPDAPPASAGPSAGPAPAQAEAESAPEAEAKLGVELDFEALLTDPAVTDGSLTDPVWALETTPGRRLIQLPLILTPSPQGPIELDDPPIDPRGSRFLAYRIPPAEGAQGSGSSRRGQANPWGNDYDLGGPRSVNAGNRGYAPPPGSAPGGAEAGDLPAGASRLARALTLGPSGTLSWELARAFPGLDVQDGGDPYQLLLRPDRLRELQPERPDIAPPSSNEDRRDYLRKRREAEAKFRQEIGEFQDRRRVIRDLPQQFTLANPPRVWAMFDVVASFRDLTLEGPDPYPWTLSFDDLDALRALAAGGRGSGEFLDAQTRQQVSRMRRMLQQDDHPLTYRIVAQAVSSADIISYATPGDPLYQLLKQLIDGPDDQARRTTLAGIATTLPPTAATASLLRDTAGQMSPQLKLLSLRSLFRADAGGPEQAKALVQTANQSLQNPDGPPAGRVIAELVDALATEQNTQRIDTVVDGVDFKAIPAERRPDAIATVLAAAPDQPAAARWLRQTLLASADPAVQQQTVAVLARAQLAPEAQSPGVNRGYGGYGNYNPRRSGRTEAGELPAVIASRISYPEAGGGNNSKTKPGASSGGENASGDGDTSGDGGPVVTLPQRLAIDSTDHGIYQALGSADPAVSDPAWSALPLFVIADGPGDRGGYRRGGGPGGNPDAAGPDRFDLLLTAALSRQPTPAGVVDFLLAQPDENRATAGLVRVAAEGGPQAGARAAKALIGSGRPLGQVLGTLPRDVRQRFAQRLYGRSGGRVPAVIGLARAPGNNAPVVKWLGDQVAAGTVPDPAAWAGVFRGEKELLDLASSSDNELARGAVAALARSAGADADTAADLANRFLSLNDRSAQAVAEQWATAKKDIYARRLAAAAGSYRLGFAVVDPNYDRRDQSPPMTPADAMRAVAVIDLTATADSVQMTNQTVTLTIPSERFAIRIDKPGELKNFDNSALSKLAVDRIDQPLDLLPREGGAWAGAVAFPDGRWLQLRLDPVQ